MSQIPATPIRQIFLILLIAGIFGVLFWNLYFFVPALLGAYTLYVLLRTPLFFLTEKWQWGEKLSAGILMLLSFIIILLPFNWVFSMLSSRIIALFQNSDTLLASLENVVRKIETQYQISLLTPENLKGLSEWAVHRVQHILSATVSGLGLFVVMYFILWFMLTEGKKMEQSFFDWLPLRHENVLYVRRHLNDMVWANALGIPLMGVVQGLAGFLIYWLADVPDPWLWFAVTFVSGMMPVVGVSLAYIPLGLMLLANGQEGKAVLIVLYGIIVVGSVDNIARMWFLKTINQTHPLITLFGVVAGLQLFGFIGFVFGPILIALLLMLLHIYHKEFHFKA
ncbi:MAG TPA: AI-2E family transporter [Saprospiraceae bacterium]|nr:AI-2E family transporter [Saprospiraceae bacterium]